MSTICLQVETKTPAYPQCQGPPVGWMGFPVVWVRGRRVRKWDLMPEKIWEKVKEAIPVFGLALRVYAPSPGRGRRLLEEHPLVKLKRIDPLVIGEKDGHFYLVAAWE